MLKCLEKALSGFGLQARGHFCFDLPEQVDQQNPETPTLLVLVGHLGSSFWPHFVASPQAQDGQDHPLDRWSQRIGDALAAQCGIQACKHCNLLEAP